MLPKFSSRAFLAPMAGVSDPALRLQCKQKGAGLVVTEFTNIHSIIAKEKQLKKDTKTIQEFIEYSEQELDLTLEQMIGVIEVAKQMLVDKFLHEPR